jgi:hypothetical protein
VTRELCSQHVLYYTDTAEKGKGLTQIQIEYGIRAVVVCAVAMQRKQVKSSRYGIHLHGREMKDGDSTVQDEALKDVRPSRRRLASHVPNGTAALFPQPVPASFDGEVACGDFHRRRPRQKTPQRNRRVQRDNQMTKSRHRFSSAADYCLRRRASLTPGPQKQINPR